MPDLKTIICHHRSNTGHVCGAYLGSEVAGETLIVGEGVRLTLAQPIECRHGHVTQWTPHRQKVAQQRAAEFRASGRTSMNT